MFQANHACRTQDKNRHKIVPGACRTELPTKIVLKTRFGTLRAPFWRGLGHSWASLGCLLAALGWRLARLGCLLGASWALLGRSWASLGCSEMPCGCILAARHALSLDFGEFGGVLGWVLEGFGNMFAHALSKLSRRVCAHAR